VVNCYTETLWAEAQQLTACNAVHQSLPRLARWLLQSADRTGSDRLPLTQEFLGEMLGLRRTTITLLAQVLQNQGIIRYTRGKITILNRAALKTTACKCYRLIDELYRDGLPFLVSAVQPAVSPKSAIR
jgi:Crp-like helix-turn-helix protein